jgi:hypothetical protein
VPLDLAFGAVFAGLASAGYRKGRLPALILITSATAAILLAWGLAEHTKYPGDEAIEVPILLAFVPPIASATTISFLGKASAPLWRQWVLAAMAWALAFVMTAVAAFYLNWITI